MKKITLLFVLVFLSANVYSQWVQTGGPTGGSVQSIAFNGNNMFLATPSNVFLSNDQGANWNDVTNNLPQTIYFGDMAVVGNNIFLTTRQHGIYMSTNNGTSWTAVNNGFDPQLMAFKFLVKGTDIYSATKNGVFFSSNNGANWSSLSTGLPLEQKTGITSISSKLFVSSYSNGVYRSMDNGLTWTQANTGLQNTYVRCLASGGSELWAGCWPGLFKSTDNGNTWTTVTSTFQGNPDAIGINGSTIIVAYDGGNVIKSTNGGLTWTDLGGIYGRTAFSVKFVGTKIYICTTAGLNVSSDGGTNWSLLSKGIKKTLTYSLNHDANTIYCTNYNGNGNYISNDGGSTWNPTFYANQNVSFIKKFDNRLIASLEMNRMYKSSDNGATWEVLLQSSNNFSNNVYNIIKIGTALFAACDKGVYKSTDNGDTWASSNNGITLDNGYAYIMDLAYTGTTIFAAAYSAGVYISANNGSSWTQVNVDNKKVLKILYVNNKVFAVTENAGIYVSSDNGLSWTQKNNGLNFNPLYGYAIKAGVNNYIYYGSGGGIYLSKDLGENWIDINYNLSALFRPVRAIDIVGDYVYIGTNGNGVHKRPLADLTTQLPAAPVSATATQTNTTSFSANWNAVNNATGYILDVSTMSTFALFVPGFQGKDVGNVLTYSVTGLNSSTPYHYRVRAYNNAGIGENSNAQTITTLSGIPSTPTLNSNNVITQTSFKAAWDVVNGVSKYYIDVSTSQSFTTFVGDYNNKDVGNVTSFMVYGLQPNVDYWFRVRAYNLAGTSPNSTPLNVKTRQNTQWIQTSGPSSLAGGPANTGVRFFMKMGNRVYGCAYYGTGLFVTTDNGTVWNKVMSATSDVVNAINDGTNIYVGTNGTGFYYSGDNGTTWQQKNSGLTNLKVYSLAMSGTNIYAATDGEGVFLSTNKGDTWAAINNGLTNKNINTVLAAGTTLFAGSSSAGVFISLNNGTSWTPTSLTGKNIIILRAINNKIYAATWSSGVYVSSNNGTTWTQINTGLGSLNCLMLVLHSNNDFFCTTTDGIYYSKNGGTTWTNINANFPSVTVWAVEVSGNDLLAGTSELGVFKRALTEIITDVEDKREIPTEFILEQNYPNPFNPSTTIRYQLPEASYVSLKVYDVLGNEVRTLIDEYKNAGVYNYELRIENGEFTSGVYFYRLTTGKFSSVKKLVLIK